MLKLRPRFSGHHHACNIRSESRAKSLPGLESVRTLTQEAEFLRVVFHWFSMHTTATTTTPTTTTSTTTTSTTTTTTTTTTQRQQQQQQKRATLIHQRLPFAVWRQYTFIFTGRTLNVNTRSTCGRGQSPGSVRPPADSHHMSSLIGRSTQTCSFVYTEVHLAFQVTRHKA